LARRDELMKLVVVGLDAASLELIEPWIEKSELPNIAKIKQEGVWANMRSVLPPVTSPNWKCYSTGKNPGEIGIFWWENIDWKNRRVYYPVARKFENKEIWDYIGEAGMKVGVMGMPTTYPPKKVNGFLMAGGEAESRNFTYPRELEDELKGYGWRNHPEHGVHLDRGKACREIHEIIDMQFKTTSILATKYNVDFLQVTIFHINTLQHFLWDASETMTGWKIIDKHIGELMNQGCDLMIMSDHGSNKIKHVFNINTWLQQEGYLTLKYTPLKLRIVTILHKLGIRQQRVIDFLMSMLGLARRIVHRVLQIGRSQKYLYGITQKGGEEGEERKAKTNQIDWQRSKAVASAQGPIYFNPENSDNETLKEEIKRKLETLVDPADGDKIIEKVYDKEDIYHGKYLAEAPDLIIDQAKGVHIPGGVGGTDVFDHSQTVWQAENKKIGLFMAYGPNIKKGEEIANVSILDLAPTILHLMNIPVPDDMDGKVLKEIFKEDSESGKREIKYQKAKGEGKRVRMKIKGLKTLGKL
jgi:predicted AlkP superfamily phosphohydrolase/phosphomutase